jgi:NNP family nitrate/nitrite transporter-like MFS transporter
MLMAAMILTACALKSPTTNFNLLLVAAWLSGTGGGAFASSMSNMSSLFPKSQQGYCLGVNGGLGNLGVSMSQLLVPMFMGMSFGKEPLSDVVDGWPNHGT